MHSKLVINFMVKIPIFFVFNKKIIKISSIIKKAEIDISKILIYWLLFFVPSTIHMQIRINAIKV